MNKPKPFRFEILTLFPQVFEPFLSSSLIGKAREAGHAQFSVRQIRDYATDKHRSVDDTPFGGGAGMLLRADVLYRAWDEARCRLLAQDSLPPRTVLLSPQGKLFTQETARAWAESGPRSWILVCGHYEGVDERFVELCVDLELSIGDYVLTGGELPALVFAETLTRLLPGVVGNDQSVSGDSLEGGLLKYAQYTRPREFQGREVPAVLLGGNHVEIEKWRREQREQRTQGKRPELWSRFRKNGK